MAVIVNTFQQKKNAADASDNDNNDDYGDYEDKVLIIAMMKHIFVFACKLFEC